MQVEYELTPDDLYAFQCRAVFESPLGRRPDGFVLSRMNFTFIVIALPIVFVAQWYLERRLVRRAILRLLKEEKSGRGQLGKHRILVNEDGVIESTAVGESRTSWAGVDRIEQNPDYIFIYTSPSAAHLIPKREFRDLHETEAFYRLSRAMKGAAG